MIFHKVAFRKCFNELIKADPIAMDIEIFLQIAS